MSGKTRRYSTIFKWLKRELKPSDPDAVTYNDTVSQHIGGGDGGFVAFIGHLRSADGFKSDELSILPGDVHPDRRVRDVMVALIGDYLRRGWRVT